MPSYLRRSPSQVLYVFFFDFCFSSLTETDSLGIVMRVQSIHHKVLNLVPGNNKCSLLLNFQHLFGTAVAA